MQAKKMLRLCRVAKNRLEDLESVLPYVPAELEADLFVYNSHIALDELRHIAKYETINSVTTIQVTHIHQILRKIDYLLSVIPDAAKRELDNDEQRYDD